MNDATIDYRPSTYEQKFESKESPVWLYLLKDDAKQVNYGFKIFVGRKTKPVLTCWYRNELTRNHEAQSQFQRIVKIKTEIEKGNQERRQKRVSGAIDLMKSLKIGDVFVSTVSYSMTINSFYQVIRIDGRRVILKQLRKEKDSSNADWSGQERPLKDNFLNDEEKLGRINGPDSIKMGDGYIFLTNFSEWHYFNDLD